MNGYYPSANFVGATGEYPIYDYINNNCNALFNNITSIKQLIDGTSNTKIDSSGLQVFHKDIINPLNNGWVNVEGRLEQDKNDIIAIKGNISGIDSTISTIEGNIAGINSTITTIEGGIATLQGEVTANTADIITANTVLATNTAAIAANVLVTTGNTLAIADHTISIGNCLTKSMVQSGDIGVYNAGLLLNLIFNSTHFRDAVVLGTNREFTLQPTYANLPTTKNNVINWNTPLLYNTSTDTASIDLSSYLTNIQTSNIFISSNSFFNNLIPNYVTNSLLSNQLYISSNAVNNLYISSNTFFNDLIPKYVTSTGLSNLFYISSNTVAGIYISSNVFSNILLNYTTNVALSNQLYISSNAVNTLYISSNTFFNDIIPNYVTNASLSNQFYTSSNTDVINRIDTSNYMVSLNQQTSNQFQYYNTSNFIANTYLTKTAGLAYNGWTKNGNDVYQTIPSGNIGIGTNTNISRAKLIVNGMLNTGSILSCFGNSSNLYPNSTANFIMLQHNTYNGNIGYNYPNPECAFIMTNNDTTKLPWGFYNGVVKYFASTGPTNSLRYDIGSCVINNTLTTLTGTNTFTPLLSILYTGNVGIGVTNPSYKLDVNGSINAPNILKNGVNIDNLYINSNNFYIGSKLFFDKSVQILSNTQPIEYTPQNASLMVGDGGRLLINGNYGGISGTNFSRIGVANQSETVGGLNNTQINLYEYGLITYATPYNPNTYGHSFSGNVNMSSRLFIQSSLTNIASNLISVGDYIVGDDTGKMTVNNLVAKSKVQTSNIVVSNSISTPTINVTDTIYTKNIVATNIYGTNTIIKTPITFTTSRLQVNIENTTSVNWYMYDIDLRKYTNQILLNGRNFRQFRIRVWQGDGNFEPPLVGIRHQLYDIFMSDLNGLNIQAYTNFLNNQDLDRMDVAYTNTLVRNSFNYISYASRLAPVTVYMIIEDLL